jgi:hypothetical protein
VKSKPKILVDEEVLAKINEFYRAKLDERYLGLECFSDPQLASHICNIEAKLENEQECDYCGHVVGRRCKVTCHISYFCLAAFAYRLGIGDPSGRTKFKGAMKHNLKDLTYAKLYQLVKALLAQEEDDATPPADAAQTEIPLASEEKPKARRKKKNTGPVFDGEGNELLTITQAAELYGCSYVTMHGYMRHSKVPRVEQGGKLFVRKVDVEAYKASRSEGGNG